MQDRQCKSDGCLSLVLQPFSPVEFMADIVADSFIQLFFHRRQGIFCGVGIAFREQRGPIKLQQTFLDHAPHEVTDVNLSILVSGGSFKPVGIKKRHEQFKILRLPVVWCGRQQQEILGNR